MLGLNDISSHLKQWDGKEPGWSTPFNFAHHQLVCNWERSGKLL